MENQTTPTPIIDNQPLLSGDISRDIDKRYFEQIAQNTGASEYLIRILDLLVAHCQFQTPIPALNAMCETWVSSKDVLLNHPDNRRFLNHVMKLNTFLIHLREAHTCFDLFMDEREDVDYLINGQECE